MAERVIQVGIVGTGFISSAHVEALRRIPNIHVAAIGGSSQRKAEEKACELGISKAYGIYDAMVRDNSIDSIHICTPNNLHFPMALQAIKAGKHVLCEKPLCMNAKEGDKLVREAEKARIVHAVAYNLRYYPLIQHLRAAIKKGRFGEVYAVHGSYLQDWLFNDTDYNWRIDPEKSGSTRAVGDIGTHWMDCVEFITGLRIREVIADFAIIHPKRRKPKHSIETFSGEKRHKDYIEYDVATEDYAEILLRFENGAKANLVVSQVSAGRKNRLTFEVDGSKQAAAWNSECPNELWIGRRDRENGLLPKDPSLAEQEAQKFFQYPGGHQEGYPDTFKQLFMDFYDQIRGSDRGKKSFTTLPTFHDGVHEVRLCESILKSSQKGKWTTCF